VSFHWRGFLGGALPVKNLGYYDRSDSYYCWARKNPGIVEAVDGLMFGTRNVLGSSVWERRSGSLSELGSVFDRGGPS